MTKKHREPGNNSSYLDALDRTNGIHVWKQSMEKSREIKWTETLSNHNGDIEGNERTERVI